MGNMNGIVGSGLVTPAGGTVLTVAGTLDPDATGDYYENGTADGYPEYTTLDGVYTIRWVTVQDGWILHLTANAVLAPGEPRWWSGSDDPSDPTGLYYPILPATGNPIVNWA